MKTMPATREHAENVLAALIKQLPFVTDDAYGPKIVQNWEWLQYSDPAPFSIIWEEGPYEWAYLFPNGGRDEEFGSTRRDVSDLIPSGVFVEPITSWAIGIYSDEW